MNAKQKRTAIVISVCFVIALAIVLTGLYIYRHNKYEFDYYGFSEGDPPPALDVDLVEKITVFSYLGYGRYELDKSEIGEFVKIFNGSEVRLIPGGTTPDFGVQILLRDLPSITLSDEGNSACYDLQFDVDGKSEWDIYDSAVKVISNELADFIRERVATFAK